MCKEHVNAATICLWSEPLPSSLHVPNLFDILFVVVVVTIVIVAVDVCRVVIATKVFGRVADNVGVNTFTQQVTQLTPEHVNQSGLSRKHIFEAVEASLKRLGM